MPGSAREVSNAIEEGIDFLWLSNPKISWQRKCGGC